jgi:hypothetical protein
MIARTCGMSPDVRVNIETGPIWTYSLAIARNPERLERWGPKLVEEYKKHLDKPYVFVDKSNCNHFIADYLKEHIPEMKFIVLLRSIEGNVCSQLRRTGNWERIMGDTLYYGFPAPFYGLDTWDYFEWSFIERLCHRWFVNRRKLVNLEKNHSTFYLDYDGFLTYRQAGKEYVKELGKFLGTYIPFSEDFYKWGNERNYLWNLNIDQKAFIADYYEKHYKELKYGKSNSCD